MGKKGFCHSRSIFSDQLKEIGKKYFSGASWDNKWKKQEVWRTQQMTQGRGVTKGGLDTYPNNLWFQKFLTLPWRIHSYSNYHTKIELGWQKKLCYNIGSLIQFSETEVGIITIFWNIASFMWLNKEDKKSFYNSPKIDKMLPVRH